jgi:hypothetical protein
MAEDHFDVVTIETDQPGQLFNVTNTQQVAMRLTAKWPAAHKGAAYKKAVTVCMAHMDGRKDTKAVRSAFIEAAKEADIFVSEGRRIG